MQYAHFLIEPHANRSNTPRDVVIAVWDELKPPDPGRLNSGVDIPFPVDVVIPPSDRPADPDDPSSRKGVRATKVGLGVRAVCHRMVGGVRMPSAFNLYARGSIANGAVMLANSVGLFEVDYRGEVIAAFHNWSSEPVVIKKGTCLVQLASPDLAPALGFLLRKKDDMRLAAFTQTLRGEGSFGSSGATHAPAPPAP